MIRRGNNRILGLNRLTLKRNSSHFNSMARIQLLSTLPWLVGLILLNIINLHRALAILDVQLQQALHVRPIILHLASSGKQPQKNAGMIVQHVSTTQKNDLGTPQPSIHHNKIKSMFK